MADDNIFPLLDRNTPVINRLRNGVGNREGEILSQAITQLISEDDEENRRAIADEAIRQIKEDLSEVSGVPEESLDGRFFDDLRNNLMRISPEDILLDDDGQIEESEEDESEDQEEPDPDQSDIEKF